MKKLVLTICLVLTVFLVTSCSQESRSKTGLQPDDPIGTTKILVAPNFEFRFTTPPVKKVRNVPENIRSVDPHHDDTWGTPGAIEKDDAKAPWLSELVFLKTGLETKLSKDIVWKNYVDYSLNWGYWAAFGGDTRERNYTNSVGSDDRGYGAALTYWEPNYDWFIPGFRTEFQFSDISNSEFANCLIGAGFRKYDLRIVTGRDRHDKYSVKDEYQLGDIYETSLFVGYNNDDLGGDIFADVRFGVTFNHFDQRSKYKSVDVEMNPIGLFLSLGIGGRW